MGIRMWYVNTYELDQGYGGPEEGGWWYSCGEFVEGVRVFGPERLAWWVRDKVQERTENLSDVPLSSVVYAGGIFTVLLEDHAGRSWPDYVPWYE